MKLYKRQYVLMAFYSELYYCGVGILDPTTYNYENLYANGYVKIIDEIVKDKETYSTRISTCKVRWNYKDKAYIIHNKQRLYLEDFIRCN